MSSPIREPSKQALGVDIGSREMKLALLSGVARTISVDAVRCIRLDTGTVIDGIILDRKGLAKKLREALTSVAIGHIPAVISIPTQHATLRWVNLPKLPPDEHRVAASFKVKKHLPYPIEDAYLSAGPVQILDGDGIGESLVISVPKHVISSRAFTAERAGLRPVSAQLEAQALLRVLERGLSRRSPLLRDASMTIVDIGGSTTDMYVVQNQKLQFIRSVRFGAARVARRIAEELGISDQLGDGMLPNPGGCLDHEGILTLPYEGQAIKISVQAELDVLIKEISRLMRYFRSLHAERSYAGILDHMVVCGGFANVRGLSEYLETRLEIRIEPLQPFDAMTLNVSNTAFELASRGQSSFAIAVGLALSQFNSEEATEDVSDDFVWARVA